MYCHRFPALDIFGYPALAEAQRPYNCFSSWWARHIASFRYSVGSSRGGRATRRPLSHICRSTSRASCCPFQWCVPTRLTSRIFVNILVCVEWTWRVQRSQFTSWRSLVHKCTAGDPAARVLCACACSRRLSSRASARRSLSSSSAPPSATCAASTTWSPYARDSSSAFLFLFLPLIRADLTSALLPLSTSYRKVRYLIPHSRLWWNYVPYPDMYIYLLRFLLRMYSVMPIISEIFLYSLRILLLNAQYKVYRLTEYIELSIRCIRIMYTSSLNWKGYHTTLVKSSFSIIDLLLI